MSRTTHVFLLSFAAALCVGGVACSGSNDPAGPTPGGAGATVTPTAGAGNTAGAPSSGAGAANVAGASTGTGGAGAGAPSSTAGATSAGAGGPATGGMFTPLCAGVPVNADMMAPTKGGSCAAATDTQLCYKTCGPQSTGFKSETCMGSIYQEQSGCSFPMEGDYSCFKIPTTLDATCPAVIPMANTACTVAPCTPCADAMGQYNDSTGMAKSGYCVCQAPTMAGGVGKWSCASTTAWPCPANKGC
jgi:hypothetical protein